MTEQDALALIQEGIAAAKAGNRLLAYPLLFEATEIDPTNELGWLWLAGVATTTDEAANCFRRVLEINPTNERALTGLTYLKAQMKQSPREDQVDASETTQTVRCPLCSSEMTALDDQCPSCGVILTLTDLGACLNNSDVDVNQVMEAIERLSSAVEGEFDFQNQYYLGLAYLNVKQIDTGIHYLENASHLNPEDVYLQSQVETLVHEHRLAGEQDAEPHRGRVMVVDDSPTVRKLVEITLERSGHEVIVAEDGMQALAKINDVIPDVILLDITMPRMDGYELCKTIKGSRVTSHIPVIMLTGKDGLIDKVRGRMVGSEEYLTKPFDPKELVQLVERHMCKQNA